MLRELHLLDRVLVVWMVKAARRVKKVQRVKRASGAKRAVLRSFSFVDVFYVMFCSLQVSSVSFGSVKMS